MTRETKAGLLMILMLAGVFGFMVYKRMNPPASAMAHQDIPQPSEGTDTPSDNTESSDPFLADEDVPAKSRVVPAVATEPAEIPDDAHETPLASKQAPQDQQVPQEQPAERDPFAIEATPTATEPRKTVVNTFEQAKMPAPMPRNSIPETATNNTDTEPTTAADEFNPFDSAPAAKPVKPIPMPVPTAQVEESQPSFGPPARSVDARKAAAEPIDVTANDPFEAPVAARPNATSPSAGPETAALKQDSESDPFSNDNLEVQTPAKPAAVPQIEAPVLGFENQPDPAPVKAPAAIDAAFDQPPAKTEVPTLKIPSAPSRPATNDERFGGFRPARPTDKPANAFPEARPAVPVSNGDATRRTSRPAPVSQIDEDFGSRPTAQPLIAGDTYQIEPNENFWTISRKKYGTGRYFMALAQHNAQVIPDPKRMKPGVTIATPSAEALDRAYPQLIPKPAAIDPVQTASASTPAASPAFVTSKSRATVETESEPGFFVSNDGVPMYRVGQEDTLSGIAQKHLGRSSRWVQVFELNRGVLTDGNSLKIGTVLQLPADASQVDIVGTPRTFR